MVEQLAFLIQSITCTQRSHSFLLSLPLCGQNRCWCPGWEQSTFSSLHVQQLWQRHDVPVVHGSVTHLAVQDLRGHDGIIIRGPRRLLYAPHRQALTLQHPYWTGAG